METVENLAVAALGRQATERFLAAALLEVARVSQAVAWIQAASAIGSDEGRRATELRVRVSAMQSAVSALAQAAAGWLVTWEPDGPQVVGASADFQALYASGEGRLDALDPTRVLQR